MLSLSRISGHTLHASHFFQKSYCKELSGCYIHRSVSLVGRTALPAEPITDRFSDGRNDGSALQVADLAGKKIDLCQ